MYGLELELTTSCRGKCSITNHHTSSKKYNKSEKGLSCRAFLDEIFGFGSQRAAPAVVSQAGIRFQPCTTIIAQSALKFKMSREIGIQRKRSSFPVIISMKNDENVFDENENC